MYELRETKGLNARAAKKERSDLRGDALAIHTLSVKLLHNVSNKRGKEAFTERQEVLKAIIEVAEEMRG